MVDGHMDGWWMGDEWLDRWMYIWIEGWMFRWIEELMDRWTDTWMDGQLEGSNNSALKLML